MTERTHQPVLLAEAVTALAVASGRLYVDATFGDGGYSRAILAAAECRLVGIDRDPGAIARGRALAEVEPRFTMLGGRFGDMRRLLAEIGVAAVDGIVLDLGLSSLQLDDPARGFAFAAPGPLDMRMGAEGPTAAELLATASEAELADVLRRLGDEPDARRIARAICRRREQAPLARTDELADLVAAVKGGRHGGRHPATKSFQALRMWVNDEVGELDRALLAAEDLLFDGGRLVVVSFHSGEDGWVKRFVDGRGGRRVGASRHLPPAATGPARWRWLERKVVRPGLVEIGKNPRARSARLRVAVRQRGAGEGADEPPGGWRCAA
jgi:16S rRNA (cytosine1402-N4)-methyltransferase